MIVFTFAFIITMLYWSGPVAKTFVFTGLTNWVGPSSGSSIGEYVRWNGIGDLDNLGLKLKVAKDIFKNILFDFSTIPEALLTVFTLIGVGLLFCIKKLNKEFKFILLMLGFGLIVALSYFITMPLLGINFIPTYIYSVFVSFSVILFALYILTLILKKLPLDKYAETIKIIALFVIIIILLLSFIPMSADYRQTKWYNVSLNEVDNSKLEMQEYILNNTDVNDVFLTTKEVGFMLNGFTGRKLISGRRAHNDPFENLDIREMEQAIILYGDNISVKQQLLRKYDVKYLYWEQYWIQSEYYFNKEGQVTGWFDPLIAFKEQRYIDMLLDNKIFFSEQNTYVDPTLKSEYHPTYDLLFIAPQNYHTFEHPWNPNLDIFLEEVWNYTQNGRVISRIYKVNAGNELSDLNLKLSNLELLEKTSEIDIKHFSTHGE